MTFVACGLNHQTASINVREKIALVSAASHSSLMRAVESKLINEFIVLSTCNRTEIYCDINQPEQLDDLLSQLFHYSQSELSRYVYRLHNQFAMHHLLRVASGLDSMMLGEPQILGQLKRAYLDASKAGTIQNNLRHIFQYVFNTAKRIRTQSGVGKNPISIAYAAAQLITQQFNDLSERTIFIIGSGETASLVAKYLHQQGARHFLIANRTQEHAQLLAQQFNGQPLSINDIPLYLAKADVVISATACPLPFIHKPLIEQALVARQQSLMLLLDLSIPRDIEANVADLEQVRLYNIDDLHQIISEGMDERRTAAEKAEALIKTELQQFIDWERRTKANELITDYRSHMKTLAKYELERAQQKLHLGKCQHSVLDELCERLVNKLTHLPTRGLRQLAHQEKNHLIELLPYLFNTNAENSTL
jgi:glutamyl-tRNA reductase